jgi:hypothetical protein
VFQCFDASCGAKGNVLDLWAQSQRLPIAQAAENLAQRFAVPEKQRVSTASAVLPANRPLSDSKLTNRSSDPKS